MNGNVDDPFFAPFEANTEFFVRASYGNDSIALIQWLHESGFENINIIYNDTGWARKDWPGRVDRCEQWAQSIGFKPLRTKSIGLAELVKLKKGWPRQGMQFCTEQLKIAPTNRLLDELDPQLKSIGVIGIRREESENRKTFPLWHYLADRLVWAPLVDTKEEARNALILRAGFEVLPHRSKECFPCINANRQDLRMLADEPERVDYIDGLERELGINSKGNLRTMYRPYRYMGATGIREIVRWAQSERGEFTLDDGTGGGNCDSGMCGT